MGQVCQTSLPLAWVIILINITIITYELGDWQPPFPHVPVSTRRNDVMEIWDFLGREECSTNQL